METQPEAWATVGEDVAGVRAVLRIERIVDAKHFPNLPDTPCFGSVLEQVPHPLHVAVAVA